MRVRLAAPGRAAVSLLLPLVPRAGEIVELPGIGSEVESFDVVAVRWRLDPAGAPPTAALELRARR
ncbi:MAG: hypothetical protein HZB56_17530 [Deltaproteobacteria bacterium]|nr:hypothetical protein [Deltaproteobacteria bacterium]